MRKRTDAVTWCPDCGRQIYAGERIIVPRDEAGRLAAGRGPTRHADCTEDETPERIRALQSYGE